MKQFRAFFALIVLISFLSSCSGSRKSKCDCPKFTDEPTKQEQVLDDNIDA